MKWMTTVDAQGVPCLVQACYLEAWWIPERRQFSIKSHVELVNGVQMTLLAERLLEDYVPGYLASKGGPPYPWRSMIAEAMADAAVELFVQSNWKLFSVTQFDKTAQGREDTTRG